MGMYYFPIILLIVGTVNLLAGIVLGNALLGFIGGGALMFGILTLVERAARVGMDNDDDDEAV